MVVVRRLKHPLGSGGGPREMPKFEMSTPFGPVLVMPLTAFMFSPIVSDTSLL